MKPAEIIKDFAIRERLDPTQVLVTIQYILTHKLGFILTKGNTVVLLVKIKPGQYECHVATKDTPISLLKSLTKIFKDIKKLQVKKMYGAADNYQIVHLIQKIASRDGDKVETPDRKGYNWMISL